MLFLWYSEGTKRNYRHFKSIFKKISLLCGYNFIMEIASLPLHCHFILFWIVLIWFQERDAMYLLNHLFWQLLYTRTTRMNTRTQTFLFKHVYICMYHCRWVLSLHLRYNVTSNRTQITTAKKSTST